MAVSVTKLREKMTGGGARPSLFFANIDMTNVIERLDTVTRTVAADDKDLSFFMKCRSPIPAKSLSKQTYFCFP